MPVVSQGSKQLALLVVREPHVKPCSSSMRSCALSGTSCPPPPSASTPALSPPFHPDSPGTHPQSRLLIHMVTVDLLCAATRGHTVLGLNSTTLLCVVGLGLSHHEQPGLQQRQARYCWEKPVELSPLRTQTPLPHSSSPAEGTT